MVPWDQILNFLALRPNAGPTQTHAGYRCTPYDFLVHVDHVFFEDIFFVFQSFLHQVCHHRLENFGYKLAAKYVQFLPVPGWDLRVPLLPAAVEKPEETDVDEK